MKDWRWTCFWMVLACISCQSAAADPCDRIPKVVADFLDKHADQTLVSLDSLVPDDQALWRAKRPQFCPGFAALDFAGDGHESYALALLSNDTKKEAVVLLRSGNGGHSVRMLMGPRPVRRPLAIWRSEKGPVDDWQTGKRFRAKHDVLVVEQLEANSTAYFRDGNQIRSVVVSN